jgi:hypothetical protein
MTDDPTENTPWREGENYDEMMSEEPFDDEEELDAEEAEQRITQFIMSADELPGPPPLRNSRSRSLRSCEQHCATLRSSWRRSPTTRCSPRSSCWVSELADCSSTTGTVASPRGLHATEWDCCARCAALNEIQDCAYLSNATTCSVD